MNNDCKMKSCSNSLVDFALLFLAIIAGAILAGFVASRIFTPEWVVPGYALKLLYPKNVEAKGFVLALGAVALISAVFHLVKRRFVRAIVTALLFVAIIPVYPHMHFEYLLKASYRAVFVFILLWALYAYFRARKEDEIENNSLVAHAVATMPLIFYLFIYSLSYYNQPFHKIDLHHYGEEFASAVDFFTGGRPFETFFWPHGFHDTGMAAVAYKLTSVADFPSMLIGRAMATSIAAVSLMALSYGLGLGWYGIAAIYATVVINPSLAMGSIANFAPTVVSLLLFAKGQKRPIFFLAGVAGFLGHVYRAEVGVFGFLAIFLFFAYQLISSILQRDFAETKARIINFIIYLFGIIVTAMAMYAILGWPGANWYKTFFSILPTYMVDSAGVPFPLPAGDLAKLEVDVIPKGTIFLLIEFGILAIVFQGLFRSVWDRTKAHAFQALMALFLVVSIRSATGRSDELHIDQFYGYMLFFLMLIAAALIKRLEMKPALKMLAIIPLFVFFDFYNGTPSIPKPAPYSKVFKDGLAVISESGEAKPPQCSEGLFSERNLKNPEFAAYDAAVCDARRIVSSLGLKDKDLLIDHSAALIYYSMGLDLPTKYYCLGWAITQDMQKELVAELEASGVKAVLFAKGFNAIDEYDIPDSVRLPVYDKWLNEKFDLKNTINTPLGRIALIKTP